MLVRTGPPLARQDQQAEQNPIHLDLEANPKSAIGEEGQVEVHSAIGDIITGTSGRRTTLQYWNLQLSGSSLQGTLVNAHTSESVAVNLVNTPKELVDCQPRFGAIPWTFVMAQGTSLRGTVTPKRVDLQIDGNVPGGTRPFQTRVTATR